MIYELTLEGQPSLKNYRELLEREIEDVLETAPSDAGASAIFKEVLRGYEGALQIVSSQGRFVAEAVNTNIKDLIQSLHEQISNQLQGWRGVRNV